MTVQKQTLSSRMTYHYDVTDATPTHSRPPNYFLFLSTRTQSRVGRMCRCYIFLYVFFSRRIGIGLRPFVASFYLSSIVNLNTILKPLSHCKLISKEKFGSFSFESEHFSHFSRSMFVNTGRLTRALHKRNFAK